MILSFNAVSSGRAYLLLKQQQKQHSFFHVFGAMKSFQNHIDPEREEQLRRSKTDVENKVKRILKLAKGINGSKEGNLKKEIIHLAEDFHQHYESLYSLYEDLRGEAKNNVNSRDDGSSSPPSDSEVYYSPLEVMHKNSSDIVINDDETSDVEDTILKDKLTSSIEVKETVFGSQSQEMKIFKDLRVQEEEPRSAAQTKDLKGEVERLKFEITSLSSQKKQWQEEVESKAGEAMQMRERISKLKGRVLELETKCKEKEGLQHEVETLSHEKDVLEERLSSETKERSIEVEGLMEQVDCLHEELVSVNTQKAELELELKKNSGNNHGNRIKKESSETQVKDFQLERKMEGQMAKTSQESNQSATEKHELLRKMSQLQTSLLLSERKLSAQERKFKQCEEDSNAQIRNLNQNIKNQQNKMEALLKEKNNLQVELETLKNDKGRYLMELEREKQESGQLKSRMDRKNTELIIKIADQQKTLLELGEVLDKLKTGNMKANPDFQVIERKMDEMAEEFRKHFEDKCRALSRRIRAAEKQHVENKEWCIKANEEYKHEKKAHQGRMEAELKNIKDMSLTANDVLVSLDSIVLKFEECNENFLSRISKTSCEVNYAMDWVRRKNNAVYQVKHDFDDLLDQLDEKEGEILVFRERVRKLENKLREMEKWMTEKDNGMMELHEEKREAIRQLCVWIDYHRCRTDYYKKMMKRMPEMNPQCRRVH